MAKFYMVIVQSVLLYGADSWVITKKHWRMLWSFHNRAARHMMNMHIKKSVKWSGHIQEVRRF